MKSLNLFFSLAVLGSLWGCADDPVEPAERALDWWPAKTGSQWVYKTTWEDTAGGSQVDAIKDTVIINTVLDEPGSLYIATNGNFELGLPNALFFKDRKIEDGTGTVWFNLDRIGDTIHRIERESYREAWIQHATTITWEEREVPAIQLQRVRHVFANFNYPRNYTLSIWYAKGVGIVRYTGKPLSAETLQVKQLVSYQMEP